MVSKITSNQEIGVIIPAYNPDPVLLGELLTRLEQISVSTPMKLLIVDDGSETPLEVPYTEVMSIQLISHSQNLGKGEALKTGFRYFFSEHAIDLVLTLDADLQHPPEKIPEFLQQYRDRKGDMIIGYRKRKPAVMPLSRIFSNTFTSLIISAITGQLVRDSQCGFRLLERSILEDVILKEKRFHLESEMLIKLGLKGVRFSFVEIPTLYNSEKSSINHLPDTLNFIQLILRILKERITGYV